MSHPFWPSLREAARRLLLSENSILKVPTENIDEAHEMCAKIGDYIPAKIDLPTAEIGMLSASGLFQIGGNEPGLEICWVPTATWSDFHNQVMDLLEAGYPGCVGCAGPGAEGEWNEEERRRGFL